jgi:DNA-binding LacI/PurR family transcriptional regulator
MKTPAPTMREVAARAKVSPSTVSLALRDSPLVAAETRQRIRALAEEVGYRMNPLVAAHMRSRRRPQAGVSAPVLAIVDTQRRRHGWRDNPTSMVRRMLVGAKAQAEARGYETREFWLHEPGMSHARFGAMLRARGIHGVLLGPSSDLQLDLELPWDWFSVVRLGSARVKPKLHRVVVDHYHIGMLAAQQAYALGFRRPLLVMRDRFSATHDRRIEAGLRMACDHLPDMRLLDVPVLASEPDRATVMAWFREQRPDVFIDNAEHNVLDHLRASGVRVPNDVSVMSMCAPAVGGPLSGCVQDGQGLGAAAVDLLISLSERNETGVPAVPMTLSISATWNPGETLRGRTERRAGRRR